MTVLAPEELAEFTIFNSIAYSWWQTKSIGEGDNNLQCWLCMGEIAKNEARRGVVEWMNSKVRPSTPFTEETVGTYIEDTTRDILALQNKVQQWKENEISLKAMREA